MTSFILIQLNSRSRYMESIFGMPAYPFLSDPDSENQNIKPDQSDFFRYVNFDFFYLKKLKNLPENLKKLRYLLKKNCTCLYNFT